MIIRSAILKGEVAPADRAHFDRHMAETVVAAIGTYPRIKGVQLRRTVERDEGAPAIYMQFDLHFDSLEDMRFALASATRQTVRAEIAKAMGMFKGRVYHVVSSRDR